VTGFIFRGDKIKHTSAPVKESAHYWVNDGDLLITRSNTTELVGHVAICEGLSEPTIYPDLIMRMKVDPRKALTEFVYYQLRAQNIREIIRTSATGANPTMKKIKKSIVQGLPIAYPSIEGQSNIVEALDELACKAQALESLYREKLSALSELKQSILQKAFAGELTADMNQEALVN
jgi:type I restriction enzyme, S subunit